MSDAYIFISKPALDALRSCADSEYRSSAVLLPSGRYRVPIGADTFASLERVRLPGETLDDVIIRMVHTHRHRLV